MPKANSTSVTKVYAGDHDVGGSDNLWSMLEQIAGLIIIIGLGCLVLWIT